MSIYHLTSRVDWDAALASGTYRMSTRGKTIDDVGFIHCSREEQLAATAAFVYGLSAEPLVVLVLDPERLSAAGLLVRTEDGGNGQQYPHIYAPLPCHLVDDVLPANVDAEGRLRYGSEAAADE